MNKKVIRNLNRIDELERVISEFREEDSPPDVLEMRQNKVEKLAEDIRTLGTNYSEAIKIYCKLVKSSDEETREFVSRKFVEFLEGLIDHASTGYWHSSSLALEILLSTGDHLSCIEKVFPGTSQKISNSLQRAIHYKLMLNSWTELPQAIEGIKLMRKISERDGAEPGIHNLRICHLLDLIATTCVTDVSVLEHPTDRQGQLSHAIGTYEEGERLAQSIDTEYARHFAAKAANLRRILHKMPPEPLFAEPLGQAVAKLTAAQHREPFLPSSAELIQEYDGKSDKLDSLISDKRFELNKDSIEAWAKKYPDSELKQMLSAEKESRNSEKRGSRIIDAQENPLGVMSIDREFTLQYSIEIHERVSDIFNTWKENGDLTIDDVQRYLDEGHPQQDWRIYHIGLKHYFESGDYIAAMHLLVTQLEGMLVAWAASQGISKKVRLGEVGELYLSDIVKRSDFRGLIGNELSDLLFWYLVNRDATRFNYRNNISHGFVNAESYDWIKAVPIIIWLTLKSVAAIRKHNES